MLYSGGIPIASARGHWRRKNADHEMLSNSGGKENALKVVPFETAVSRNVGTKLVQERGGQQRGCSTVNSCYSGKTRRISTFF